MWSSALGSGASQAAKVVVRQTGIASFWPRPVWRSNVRWAIRLNPSPHMYALRQEVPCEALKIQERQLILTPLESALAPDWLAARGNHQACQQPPTHLEHAVHGGAGAGAPPARRSSSHPPACCSGPEIHLQTASAGLSPIAENEKGRGSHRLKETQNPARRDHQRPIWGGRVPISWLLGAEMWCLASPFLPLPLPQTRVGLWGQPFPGNQHRPLLSA